MAERDHLTEIAISKLNQLVSVGTAMLVEGAQGITLQHIFASWYAQGTPMPSSDKQDHRTELQVGIEAIISDLI